jgi:hypothetical protein
MGLLDLFKPKWKHSDAEVRSDAVRQLGEGDKATLAEIARGDEDARVRRIALKKIVDADLLKELSEHDPDEALRRTAAEKAAELWLAAALAQGDEPRSVAALERLSSVKALIEVAKRGASGAVRKGALARITEPKALGDVARHAEDPHVALQAVARLSDPGLLKDLALAEVGKAIALEAIARLDDPAALATVAQKGRNKVVRGAAKEKLATRAPAEEAGPPAAAIDPALEARLKARDAERARKAAEEEARLRQQKERRAALEADVQAKKARAEAAQAAEAERRDAERQEAALRAEAEREKATAEKAELETRRAADKARKKAEADERAARVSAMCTQLLEIRETTDRKLIKDALKDSAPLVEEAAKLGRAEIDLKERLASAINMLKTRDAELREAESWKRWSTVPQFEALCARIEALLELVDLDPKKSAADLKAAQAEWKALGAPPRDKSEALWARFRQACDQLHERNRKQYAVLDEARGANLQRKEELCARVEAVADSSDWKETAELIKLLQEEWKAIGPVPREQADAVWKRFRAACDKFFDRRKATFSEADERRAESLKIKEALCVEAEQLKDSTDYKGAAERLKALQAEWKDAGSGPRGASEAAWKRFRAACDHFFERRKAHFAAQDGERKANLEKKEALCQKVEAMTGLEADPGEVIRGLMVEWKTIGPAPRDDADRIWDRFRTACDRLRTPEPVAPEAAPTPTADGRPPSKFENRLPLAGIADRLTSPGGRNDKG